MLRSLLYLSVLFMACTRPEEISKTPPVSMPVVPVASDSQSASGASIVTSSPASIKPVVHKADYCKGSSECGWDNSCMPARCVGSKNAERHSACDESSMPPGDCLCLESYCTLKPKKLPEPVVTGCKANDDCEFEASTGTCMAKDEYGQGPIKREGGVCTCEEKSGACKLEWVGPVSCKTYKDCSWTRNPLRPVPSSVIPRPNPKPVKACSTGEVDSICNKESVCEVVAWKC